MNKKVLANSHNSGADYSNYFKDWALGNQTLLLLYLTIPILSIIVLSAVSDNSVLEISGTNQINDDYKK